MAFSHLLFMVRPSGEGSTLAIKVQYTSPLPCLLLAEKKNPFTHTNLISSLAIQNHSRSQHQTRGKNHLKRQDRHVEGTRPNTQTHRLKRGLKSWRCKLISSPNVRGRQCAKLHCDERKKEHVMSTEVCNASTLLGKKPDILLRAHTYRCTHFRTHTHTHSHARTHTHRGRKKLASQTENKCLSRCLHMSLSTPAISRDQVHQYLISYTHFSLKLQKAHFP